MADPAPRPSNELRTRIGIGLALIAVAIGALLAGGAIFWILVSVAGLLMQAEWADLAEAPAQNKRLSLFALSVPLAILSPFAAVDRKSVVKGKGVSVSVDLGGRRLLTKKNKLNTN